MPDEDDDPIQYFVVRGYEVRTEERDLHAECLVRGELGRASFYVSGRLYTCVDLLRDGAIVAEHYADGASLERALAEAKRRHGSEQG